MLTLLLVYINIVLEEHICLSGATHLIYYICVLGSNFSKKIENHVVGTDLDIRFGLVADDTSAASDAHDVVHDYNNITINKVIIYICFMCYCLGVLAHLVKCRYFKVRIAIEWLL